MFVLGALLTSSTAGDRIPKSVYDFTMKNIDGHSVPLVAYKGKVILIVNVASECGFTPQYRDLEDLFRKYRERGFVVLGFPANNFGAQEPGTDVEIKAFCETNYNVSFDLFSKISVKGADQHPLYKFLTSRETDPDFAGDVKWNFQKYLVGRDGMVIGRFMSAVGPMSRGITAAIEAALK